MAPWTPILISLFVAGIWVYGCSGTLCSSESDCLHFEHCCKGNCTSKQLQCHHICSHDIHCTSNRRCVLGLCVNCTEELACENKKCLNDTHCPNTHSCDDNACSIKKSKDLTGEMLPFIIFISALSISLLIVCYNDYILERLGHRSCTECIDRTICNCSLILKIWMWRHRRLQARNAEHTSCPVVEVQFDSRILNPSNMFSEKRETGFSCSFRTILDRLKFWRHCNGDRQAIDSMEDENIDEESHESATRPSVILLDEYMNTNEVPVERTSDSPLIASSDTETTAMGEINQQDQNPNQNQPCYCTVPDLSQTTASTYSSRSSGGDGTDVNMSITSNRTSSIATASHLVTTV